MKKYNKDKIEKDNERDILETKKDIMTLEEAIESMDKFDKFYKLENKNNDINTIKYDLKNRKSSPNISTRFSSANVKKESKIALKKKNNIGSARKKRSEQLKPSMINIDNNFNKNKFIKQQIKTMGNSDNALENLYDKMSTKENLLIYQPDIKEYLENKKFDVSIKLTPSIVCNNFEKTREKICTSDFLKNNIQLRKQMGNIESKVEEINNNDIKAINKMNNIEDKMIKLFCDINNPKPKE